MIKHFDNIFDSFNFILSTMPHEDSKHSRIFIKTKETYVLTISMIELSYLISHGLFSNDLYIKPVTVTIDPFNNLLIEID